MRLVALALAASSLALAGCGQSGDLYLPEERAAEPADAPAGSAAPAEEDDKKDQP